MAFALIVTTLALWALIGSTGRGEPSAEEGHALNNGDAEPPQGPSAGASLAAARQRSAPEQWPAGMRGAPSSDDRLVHGRVVEEESGAPIPGAFVFPDRGAWGYTATEAASRTDEEGRFSLQVEREVAAVKAAARGFRPGVRPLPRDGGPEPGLVLRLCRGVSIQGAVVDERGAPLVGATVWASRPRYRTAWPSETTTFAGGTERDGDRVETDTTGAFTIEGLEIGVRYEVVATCPGFFHAGLFHALVRAPESHLTLRLLRLTLLAVSVLGDDGEDLTPISGVAIRKPRRFVEVSSAGLYPEEDPRSGAGYPDSALTFAFAAERLEGVKGPEAEQDLFMISATCTGYVSQTVQVRPSEGHSVLARLTLARVGGGVPRSDLDVCIRMADGSPGRGRWLLEIQSPKGEAEAVAVRLAAGTATVRSPVGRCRVRVRGGLDVENEGFASPSEYREVDVRPEGRVSLAIDIPAVPVVLDVRDSSNRPIDGYDLRVAGGGRASFGPWSWRWHPEKDRSPPSADGQPRIYCSPGRLRVQVNMPDVGGGEGQIDVVAGGERVLMSLILEAEKEVKFREVVEAHLGPSDSSGRK